MFTDKYLCAYVLIAFGIFMFWWAIATTRATKKYFKLPSYPIIEPPAIKQKRYYEMNRKERREHLRFLQKNNMWDSDVMYYHKIGAFQNFNDDIDDEGW